MVQGKKEEKMQSRNTIVTTVLFFLLVSVLWCNQGTQL